MNKDKWIKISSIQSLIKQEKKQKKCSTSCQLPSSIISSHFTHVTNVEVKIFCRFPNKSDLATKELQSSIDAINVRTNGVMDDDLMKLSHFIRFARILWSFCQTSLCFYFFRLDQNKWRDRWWSDETITFHQIFYLQIAPVLRRCFIDVRKADHLFL